MSDLPQQSLESIKQEDKDTNEKYIYVWDYSPTDEQAFVQIIQKENEAPLILVQFPNNDTSITDNTSTSPHVRIFINTQWHFSFNWLPLVTWNDFYKYKNMFFTCYLKLKGFQNQNQPNHLEPTHWVLDSFAYQEINFNRCSLTCANNEHCTDITIHWTDPKEVNTIKKNILPVVQFKIGPYLNFCSNRDLPQLPPDQYFSLLMTLLSKLFK